ncbi:TPR-like protein [Piedraia hortae CBS 480.64]|uniref:TPR-like protein n=1 Tax=Piedraia hortae CBS 480.64 TaxID=1314780 RepID=A0A6A7CDZ8_9PEZI|nr:TPR-like protein [Piedraia hortae CBS 480.64]
MALPVHEQQKLQAQLRQAVAACSERCLYRAAAWIAELLNSMKTPPVVDMDDTDIDEDVEEPPVAVPSNPDKKEALLEAREADRYALAKALFDVREFDRCAAVFLPTKIPHMTPVPNAPTPERVSARPRKLPKLSQKSLFLALYARYMAGEKRKNEESETILGPYDGPATTNKEIPGILSILEEYFAERGGLDNPTNSQGWLDYLCGIVFLRTKSDDVARTWLLRAVNLQPFNWSAWLELASLTDSAEKLVQVHNALRPSIMAVLWSIHCKIEIHHHNLETLKLINQSEIIFPKSAWLLQQKALLHYHARDHEAASQMFESLILDHPFRLEGLEAYSNLLYVIPHRPKLASLAGMASETDRFRPETNCILGNYYSLVSEHEKAVLHFRRALALDRNFQAAWTLMGHEYIELKNTQAAIESYRRAVDAERRDYRAWYGLGQGYEMLECHSYSLFYYQRAAGLCPSDPKMWAAVGNAYAKCNKLDNAIQAYKRAVMVGSMLSDTGSSFGSDPMSQAVGGALDPQILYDLACLYERQGVWHEAASYMKLTLAQEEGADDEEGLGVTQITSRARLWLAKWYFHEREWSKCLELCNELCQDGIEVEEAKGLQRDVRARLQKYDEE